MDKYSMKGREFMKLGRILIVAVLFALIAVAFAQTGLADGEVCQIGSKLYTTLDDALFEAVDGDTIKLLANIDYNHGLNFVNEDITFDLNGYNLNVVNSSGNGLFANNCVIDITGTDGGGEFNVTGTTRGVMALTDASVTVTNANATSELGAGVYSGSGAEVTVQGNATATGANSIGAYTEDGSIFVLGDARGVMNGAVSYLPDSSITIGGDAIATGAGGVGATAGDFGKITIGGDAIAASAGCIGAEADNGGEIIIDGEIQTSGIYIRIDSRDMAIGDVTLPTTKAGYHTYSGGVSSFSTIWVKMRITCEIVGGTQYEKLVDALTDANDGDTVRLLSNIAHNSGISIAGKTLTLDLNGYDLNVNETSGTGLTVSSGGIILTGSGNFNVTGYECGVQASSGGVTTVTSATAKSNTNGVGITASGGGKVTVTNDVYSGYSGIVAIGDNTEIIIGGNVTVAANETWGIEASGGANVDVGGDMTVNGGGGVLVQADNSVVHVSGSVTATDGAGVTAMYGGHATVDGNVQASAEGVRALGVGSTVTVGRNLFGNTGVSALSGGHVEVRGGVGAVMKGVEAGYDDSLAIIHGGVIVNGEAGIGAHAFGAESSMAVIWIDSGSITSNTYILINGEVKDGSEASRTIPTLQPGYYTYSSGSNIVYVKEPEVEGGPPVVVTDTVTGITASGAMLSGNVTDDGGIEVYERGFVYSLEANPEIGVEGVTGVTAGSGTGSFSASITGLTPATIYHVRAYASNEAGTSYGEDRMFTTHSVTPPPDTPVTPPSYTDDDGPPTVSTGPVTGITMSGATLSGKVTSSGGVRVTERGFVYGMSANPVIGGSDIAKVSADGGLGEFTAEITGLVPGITYYVRAYAINREGTAYGANVSFTTELFPPAGETGWLDASATGLTSGNVVLYTNLSGEEYILGLSIVEGSVMKYISRGPGDYEIIYNAKPFDDISGHWAKNDIDFNTARLLFIGVTPRLFSPDTAMTRGMFVAVLGRMYGVDPLLYTGHTFSDVPQSAYYAPYVKWARENNIIFGMSESIFEPERAITRQEMATMIHRFMKYLGLNPENGGEEFSDADAISPWARESVMSLRETGILNGKPGNLFDPGTSSTRAEVTAVLRRLIEYIVNKQAHYY
jgi:hypothetical protein